MFNEPLSILLAEDDPNLGALLVDYLSGDGYAVHLCCDGEEALKNFRQRHFDLCLLDVMMPRMDGFTLAREIRTIDNKIPLLFITARTLKEDKLKGYAVGADDYITKPFDEEELLWKIKAITRRMPEGQNDSVAARIPIGEYLLDVDTQSLVLNNVVRRITEKECEILKYLFSHRNRVIRREVMLKDLWGKNDYFLGRSLDVFITKIRRYLKDDPGLKVENVFGVGFIFSVPEPGNSDPI